MKTACSAARCRGCKWSSVNIGSDCLSTVAVSTVTLRWPPASAQCSILATVTTATFRSSFPGLVDFLVPSYWIMDHCPSRRYLPSLRKPLADTTAPVKVSALQRKPAAPSLIRPIRWVQVPGLMVRSAITARATSSGSATRTTMQLPTTLVVVVLIAYPQHSRACSSSTAAPQHTQILPHPRHRQLLGKIRRVVLRLSLAILRPVSPRTRSQMDMCVMAIRKVRSPSAKNSIWPAETLVTPCLVRCPNLTTNHLLQS